MKRCLQILPLLTALATTACLAEVGDNPEDAGDVYDLSEHEIDATKPLAEPDAISQTSRAVAESMWADSMLAESMLADELPPRELPSIEDLEPLNDTAEPDPHPWRPDDDDPDD